MWKLNMNKGNEVASRAWWERGLTSKGFESCASQKLAIGCLIIYVTRSS